MARKGATQVDNKFVRGLITENTALGFPENAATETWNCVFDDDGTVTRRLGYDYETGGSVGTIDVGTNAAITEYVWTFSKGVELKTFVVVQYGSLIYFYNASDTTIVGPTLEEQIDLTNYPLDISFYNPAEYPCQYATGNNQLIITNKAVNPLLVSYDDVNETITVRQITLKFRDFEGVEDGLALTTRPTSSLADLQTNNPEHYYNLLNQGWHITDALTQWDSARTDMPSNADQVLFFRASETDSFDNARVTAYSGVMNTPAPKGHFVLSLGNISRTNTMLAEGFTAVLSDEGAQLTGASYVTNSTDYPTAYFDNTTTEAAAIATSKLQTHANPSTHMYVGLNLTGTPSTVGFATVYPTSDDAFADEPGPLILTLIGSNTSPTNPYDGTLLGTYVINNINTWGTTPVTIGSSDLSTEWNYVWVTWNSTSFLTSLTMRAQTAEVKFFSTTSTFTYARPQTCSFFAGRAWYAGIEDGSYNNSLYFSRIVLKDEDYDKCYQANDPTSEFISEVLPDDGGVIRLIEAARILKLFAYQNSLLVFCSNGIWRIRFGTTTDFDVRKISAIGIDSIFSVADVKGIPVWWAEDGIYTIKYEANFDAFSVVSLTEDTIKRFFLEIPRANRKYAKAVYDTQEDLIYWIYHSTVGASNYTYNKVLCLDSKTSAFYPWAVGTSDAVIRGGFYLRDVNGEEEPTLKFLSLEPTTGTIYNVGFGGFTNTDYIDWETQGDSVDYESYFITGYKIHGDTQRFSQPNYVFVFLNTETNSSCLMHAIYDFTNSGTSGKWSSSQQVYNSALTYRDVNFRRLKVRGKGRSIQFKFNSESGKPFNIIGWSMAESQNGSL